MAYIPCPYGCFPQKKLLPLLDSYYLDLISISLIWDFDSGNYLAVLFQERENVKGILTDLEAAAHKIDLTTSSVFQHLAYQEIDFSEICKNEAEDNL